MKLVVSQAAAADFTRLHAFLVSRNPVAARRAVATLSSTIQSLTSLAERGRPSGAQGLRELLVPFGQSAYVVRYAVDAERNEIVIMRIWHAREQRE